MFDLIYTTTEYRELGYLDSLNTHIPEVYQELISRELLLCFQLPGGPHFDRSESCLGPTQSGLEDGAGDGQGTRARRAGSPFPQIRSQAVS
jgi:hypothetical protein